MEWAVNEVGVPLDTIEIQGISAHGYHGLLESERAHGQPFIVDVKLHCDTRSAAEHDDINQTIDYAAVVSQIGQIITGEPVYLIETLAQRVADVVLASGAIETEIAVHKPSAPLGVAVNDVIVRIHRTNAAPFPAEEPAPGAMRRGAHRIPSDALNLQDLHQRPAELSASAAKKATADDGPLVDIEALRAAGVPLTRRAIAQAEAEARAARNGAAKPAGQARLQPDQFDLDLAQAPVQDLDTPPRWPADVILALGGNVGDALGALRGAVEDLASVPGIEILGVSPLARTKAVPDSDQQDYFNAVVAIRTTLAPRALLYTVQGIETQHGRTHDKRWGPRTLDIDIVTYDTLMAADDELELPHPRASQRAFVLLPWATLAPDAFLPGLDGGSVAVLAELAPDRDGVRWLALDWLTVPVALSGALPKPPVPVAELPWAV